MDWEYTKYTTDREYAKYLSEVLKAYSEGKTIQYEYFDKISKSYKWQDLTEFNKMNFSYGKYRIKQDPKYRAYKNAEEFLKAQKEHGPYYIQIDLKDESYYMLPGNVTNTSFITYNGCQCPYMEFVLKYVWQDGTPCGIQE